MDLGSVLQLRTDRRCKSYKRVSVAAMLVPHSCSLKLQSCVCVCVSSLSVSPGNEIKSEREHVSAASEWKMKVQIVFWKVIPVTERPLWDGGGAALL